MPFPYRPSTLAPSFGHFGFTLGALAIASAVFLSSCASKTPGLPTDLNRSGNVPVTLKNESKPQKITFGAYVTPPYKTLPIRSWILAAPDGDFTWNVNNLRLNNLEAPGSLEVHSLEEFRTATGIEKIDSFLTVRDLGVWRNHRLLSVVANPNSRIRVAPADNREKAVQHRLVEFELEVRFAEPASKRRTSSSPKSAMPSEISEFLRGQVANPEGVDLYALAKLPPAPEYASEALVATTPWEETGIPVEEWKAISVTENDLYALDGRWMIENGLDPAATTPEEVVLFSRGHRIPLLLLGGEPNTPFATGGRVAFWGEKSQSHETNARVYYVAVKAKPDATMLLTAPTAVPVETGAQDFQRTIRLEQDNTLEKRLGNFLTVRDMTWVWGALSPTEPTPFEFNLPGLPTDVPEAKAQLFFYQSQSGLKGTALLEVSVNGNRIQEAQLTSTSNSLEITIPANILKRVGNVLEIRSADSTPNQTLGLVYLDNIELQHESLFRGDNGRLEIQFAESDGALSANALQLSNFRFLQTRVIDLENPEAPTFRPLSVTARDGFIAQPFSSKSRLLVFEQDRLARAPQAQPVVLPTALNADQPTTTLIITHPDFLAQANRLEAINAHSPKRALADSNLEWNEVTVVLSDSIYHAQSGGELSSEAIRQYLAQLIRTPEGKSLDHVILFGDCTSDGQRVTRNNVLNFIPTYAYDTSGTPGIDPYACDAYYSWLAGNDQVADLFVSRISVNNDEDATAYVDKTVEHLSGAISEDWTKRIFALTDAESFSPAFDEMTPDFSTSYTLEHARSYDAIWEDNYYLPESVVVEKISKVSPVLTRRIASEFNNGVGTVIYLGHGSPNIWSNQRIWFGGDSPSSDNLLLQNKGKYPFLATFTCNNGAIDYPIPQWNVTIVEDMMRQKEAGTIAAFVPSGPGYTRSHMALLQGLIRAMNNGGSQSYASLGEAARLNYQSVLGEDSESRMFLTLGAGSLHQSGANLPQVVEPLETYTNPLRILRTEQNTLGDQLTLSILNDNPSQVSAEVFVHSKALEGVFADPAGEDNLRRSLVFLKPYSVQKVSFPIYEKEKESLITGEIKSPLNVLQFQFTAGTEYLPSQDLRIAPSNYAGQKPNYQILAANPRSESILVYAELEFTEADGTKNLRKTANYSIPAKAQTMLEVTVNTGTQFNQPEEVSVTLYEVLKSDDSKVIQSRVLKTNPNQLTDLVLLPKTLAISPEKPTAGATIFVEGFVENRSSVVSTPTRIALYLESEPEKELSSRAPHPLANLEHILPGEKGFFRTRWDPVGKVGDFNLQVVLDPDSRLVEASRENNRATLPLSIRTKWNLVPAGIAFRPLSEEGFVELSANVLNKGESNALEVVVLFYSSEKQTEETLIGQVPLEIVPAGEERIATFKWDVRQSVSSLQVKPSFAISLRGSRQRISSVTD